MATESDDRVFRLTTPLDQETLRSLRVGDEVWLDGIVWGVRDATLIRLFDEGVRPDIDFSGAAFLHTAPSVKRESDGRWVPVSVGTTTSMRMDRFTEGCVGQLGVGAIIGKGGLGEDSLARLGEHGAVYLAITGGAASPETLQVEEIEDFLWEDLMPECLWKFRMKGLGPLFVAMDAHGGSEYRDVKREAERNLEAVYRRLGI